MQNGSSFIDLVVRDSIREHFVSGSVLAITDGNLDKVLWANAAGASAFADETLIDAIDAPTLFSRTQKRQVLNGLDSGKANMVRVGARLVPISVSHIELGSDEHGILLSAPNPNGHATLAQRAKGMIDGLEEAQSRAAIIKSDGTLVASTKRFVDLDISPAMIKGLISEVAQEEDRLVKRPIQTALGHLPSAIGRLDHEDLHLLMVVTPAKSTVENDGADSAMSLVGHPKEAIRLQSNRQSNKSVAAAENIAAALNLDSDFELAGEQAIEPTLADEEKRTDSSPEKLESVQEELVPLPTTTQRFVWKTNKAGELLEASGAFAALLNTDETILIGRPFASIMAEHGAEDANLLQLMARQDTWSGREMLVALKGRDLTVPVVLSALPQRDRDNAFSGYRGFGLIRFEDAAPLKAHLLPEAPEDVFKEAPLEQEIEEMRSTEVHVLGVADVFVDDEDDADEGMLPLGVNMAQAEQALDATETEAHEAALENEAEIEAHHDEAAPDKENGIADEQNALDGDDDGAVLKDDMIDPTIDAELTAIDEVLSGDLSDKEREAFAEIRRQLIDNAPAANALAARRSEGEAITSLDASKTPDTASVAKNNVLPIKFGHNITEKQAAPAPKANNQTYPATPRFMPSAFAAIDLLPRKGDIELSVLDQLPLAVMLQRGDDVIYANDHLLNLSGFDDLGAIAEAGGLEAIFEEPESSDEDDDGEGRALRSVMRLKRRHDDGLDAEAHIQVINFEGSRALLLALLPIQSSSRHDLPHGLSTETNSAIPADTHHDATIVGAIFDGEQNADPAVLIAQIEELHGILDTATDGVILLDGVANIRSINKSAEALFGYDNDAVRSKPFTTLFAIESHRSAMEYLTALTDNGVASVMNDGLEVIGREKEGRFIPLFMTLGRLAGSNGYCAVLRDITPWKRAEENLTLARKDAESASTQKTAFLARISHEIRTPLNAIIGFSDLMLDDRFGSVKDDRSREYLKDINKSGGLVLDLVNDLLDLSKIEAGEQELEFSAVAINELLRESVSMMQPKANQQRVIIRSSLSSDLPDVVADARSIKQIALNLLSNAVRFTNPGGQVVISSALMDDGCVAIRFRDTGIGMSEDQIEQAMQPYKQVHSEDVIETKDGSGLGLPLTKAMVEGNRADIMITSTPGVGTIVEVIFPANRVLSE